MSTSLFTIQCETCTARLKVCDPSTVGQILACPKCESMVQVIPPPGWEGPAAGPSQSPQVQPSSSGTVPAEKTPLAESSLAKKTSPETSARQETSAKKPTTDQSAVERGGPRRSPLGRPALRQEKPSSSKQQAKREKVAATAAAVAPAPPPIESPATAAQSTANVPPASPLNLPPGAGWVSPTEKLVRQWLLVGGLLVGGGVVAGALVTWMFVSGKQSSTEELSDADTPRNNNDKDQAPQPGGKGNQPASPTKDVPDSAHANTATKSPNETPEPSPKDPADESTAVTPPVDTPPDNNDNATAQADPPKDVGPLESGGDIPADIIPDVDLPNLDGSDPNDPVVQRKNRRRPLEVIDVESRLQDPIAQIEFRKLALWRYLDFISRMSTIPITLDTDALRQRGVSASEPVSVKLDDTTIEAAIESVLERVKLKFEIERGHLLVTTPRDDTSTLNQRSFVVSDLTAGDANALDQLAKLVPRLVAPAEWQTDRGRISTQDGLLVVHQTSKVMRQVDVFLKRLRVARDTSKKAGPTSDRLAFISRYARVRVPLSQKVAASYTVPTPLIEIIDRLRQQTKLVVLVDWQSLAAIHVGPMTDARMSARDKPLESALGTLLAPLDLTFRIVDSETIEISSEQRDTARHEIEFHSLQGLASGGDQAQRLIGQIRKDLGADPSATLHYDPASNCLIVSAGGRLQIEIEKRLDIERAKTVRK